ncbi:hypothetical protein TGAMA5MH_00456 [Trichoderma gamsii]|uniref:Uncharacterized protein n=1 Tax=Trichoderma gamsii TaxID=398673 RepID=A0A2K0TSB4_9HYPO|nr:hypothetical protein TGAMA5MH_00456 [Trichoderma gamsii]
MRPCARSNAAFEDLKSDEHNIINDIPDDDEATTLTAESKNNTDAHLIKGSYDVHKIVWKNTHEGKKQAKEIEHINLNVYMNTSANTAMFTLSSRVTPKAHRRKRSNKQHIYLLMPPERIKAITVLSNRLPTVSDSSNSNTHALHFSLAQSPDYVGPEDHYIRSIRTTQERLAFMRDLTKATELTFHLASSNTIAQGQEVFKQLAATFSLNNTENRPRNDETVGNLATLYAGKGGKISHMNDNLVHAGASPPSYAGAVLRSPLAHSKKRRLNPSERPKLDVNDEKSPTLIALIQGIYTRLDDIDNQSKTRHNDLKTRLDDIENQFKTRHNDLKSQLEARFNTLEESMEQIRSMQENLESVHTPCRYDSKEREFLKSDVIETCEQSLEELQTQKEEASEDMADGCLKGVTAIEEVSREAKLNLQETAVCLEKDFRKGLRELLQEVSETLK